MLTQEIDTYIADQFPIDRLILQLQAQEFYSPHYDVRVPFEVKLCLLKNCFEVVCGSNLDYLFNPKTVYHSCESLDKEQRVTDSVSGGFYHDRDGSPLRIENKKMKTRHLQITGLLGRPFRRDVLINSIIRGREHWVCCDGENYAEENVKRINSEISMLENYIKHRILE